LYLGLENHISRSFYFSKKNGRIFENYIE